MASVGIRELKEHTSEIMRRVRDDGETIDVTYRGEIVATITPNRPIDRARDRAFWERQRVRAGELAKELGDTPIDVVRLLDEDRRRFTPDEMLPVDWQSGS